MPSPGIPLKYHTHTLLLTTVMLSSEEGKTGVTKRVMLTFILTIIK